MVVPITSVEQFRTVLEESVESNGIIVIDFGATWCGPCRRVSPLFEQWANDNSVSAYSIDIDEVPDVAHRYAIKSIPTFKILVGGVEKFSSTGGNLEPVIENYTTCCKNAV